MRSPSRRASAPVPARASCGRCCRATPRAWRLPIYAGGRSPSRWSGVSVAMSLGVPAGTFVSKAIGWHATFGILSVFALGLIAWIIFGVPDFPGLAPGKRASVRQALANPGVRAVLTDPIDFVAIVTPNHLHLPVAAAAIAAGFPVMSDKPATTTYSRSSNLRSLVANSGFPTASPTLMRVMGWSGKRAPSMRERPTRQDSQNRVEYLQGWLSRPIETTGQKQAAWRSDPAQNGPGGCIGDIGVHAFPSA